MHRAHDTCYSILWQLYLWFRLKRFRFGCLLSGCFILLFLFSQNFRLWQGVLCRIYVFLLGMVGRSLGLIARVTWIILDVKSRTLPINNTAWRSVLAIDSHPNLEPISPSATIFHIFDGPKPAWKKSWSWTAELRFSLRLRDSLELIGAGLAQDLEIEQVIHL